MSGKERPPPSAPDTTEKTRELIREFVETPPAKTIADVKAASDVYEANAKAKGADQKDEEKTAEG